MFRAAPAKVGRDLIAIAMLDRMNLALLNATSEISPPCPGIEPGGQTHGTSPLPHSHVMLLTVTFLIGGKSGTQSSLLRTYEFVISTCTGWAQ